MTNDHYKFDNILNEGPNVSIRHKDVVESIVGYAAVAVICLAVVVLLWVR
jgi:hypothetical protein